MSKAISLLLLLQFMNMSRRLLFFILFLVLNQVVLRRNGLPKRHSSCVEQQRFYTSFILYIPDGDVTRILVPNLANNRDRISSNARTHSSHCDVHTEYRSRLLKCLLVS